MQQFQNCKLIKKLLWSHSVNVIILQKNVIIRQKRLCTTCCLWLLISCSFNVVPIKLNSSCRVKVKRADADIATHDSILDTYSKGQKYVKEVPDFMEVNFINFAKKYKVAKDKLINQAENMIPTVLPTLSSNVKWQNFLLYCKYQFVKYKPWHTKLEQCLG